MSCTTVQNVKNTGLQQKNWKSGSYHQFWLVCFPLESFLVVEKLIIPYPCDDDIKVWISKQFIFQIIHLKRFQFLNNRWVKSHKIVKFPTKDFDPRSYLAQRTPQHKLDSYLSQQQKIPSANNSTNHNRWKSWEMLSIIGKLRFYMTEIGDRQNL